MDYLFSAEGEKLPHQASTSVSGLPNLCDQFCNWIIGAQVLLCKRATPIDDAKNVVEIVGNAARKTSHSFQSLCVLQLCLKTLSITDVFLCTLIVERATLVVAHQPSIHDAG